MFTICTCITISGMVFSFRLEWDKIEWERIGKEGAAALAYVLRVTKDFKILKYVSNCLGYLRNVFLLNAWAVKFCLSSFVKYLLALILEFSPQ